MYLPNVAAAPWQRQNLLEDEGAPLLTAGGSQPWWGCEEHSVAAADAAVAGEVESGDSVAAQAAAAVVAAATSAAAGEPMTLHKGERCERQFSGPLLSAAAVAAVGAAQRQLPMRRPGVQEEILEKGLGVCCRTQWLQCCYRG